MKRSEALHTFNLCALGALAGFILVKYSIVWGIILACLAVSTSLAFRAKEVEYESGE